MSPWNSSSWQWPLPMTESFRENLVILTGGLKDAKASLTQLHRLSSDLVAQHEVSSIYRLESGNIKTCSGECEGAQHLSSPGLLRGSSSGLDYEKVPVYMSSPGRERGSSSGLDYDKVPLYLSSPGRQRGSSSAQEDYEKGAQHMSNPGGLRVTSRPRRIETDVSFDLLPKENGYDSRTRRIEPDVSFDLLPKENGCEESIRRPLITALPKPGMEDRMFASEADGPLKFTSEGPLSMMSNADFMSEKMSFQKTEKSQRTEYSALGCATASASLFGPVVGVATGSEAEQLTVRNPLSPTSEEKPQTRSTSSMGDEQTLQHSGTGRSLQRVRTGSTGDPILAYPLRNWWKWTFGDEGQVSAVCAEAPLVHVEIQCTPEERVVADTQIRYTLKFAHTVSVRANTRMPTLKNYNKCFVLDPTGQIRIAWCIISILCLTYDGFFIPLQVFPIKSWVIFDMIEVILAIFWTIDIFVTFRCGYIDGISVVMRQKEIARHYLETWFFFDFLVCAGEWFIILNPWTTPKFFRSLKLVRLLRAAKVKAVAQQVEDRFNAWQMSLPLTLVKLTGSMLIVVHFVTCGWYLIGEQTEDGWTTYVEEPACGTASLDISLTHSKDLVFWYFNSARWVLAQVNGRTDQDHRRNIMELLFTCVVAVSGPLVFVSIFVSSITASMMEMSRSAKNKRTRARQLKGFLKAHAVSPHLAAIMKLHVRNTKIVQDDEEVLLMFPWNLKQDILCEIRRPTITSHSIFRLINRHFPRACRHICIHNVENHMVFQGDNVFSKGDACSRMYFVVRGTFHYRQKVAEDGQSNAVSTATGVGALRSGMGVRAHKELTGVWFCEAALWLDWYNQGCLETTSDAYFLVLEASKFADGLKTYWQTRPLVCAYAQDFQEKLLEHGHVSDIIDLRVRIDSRSPTRTSQFWCSEPSGMSYVSTRTGGSPGRSSPGRRGGS